MSSGIMLFCFFIPCRFSIRSAGMGWYMGDGFKLEMYGQYRNTSCDTCISWSPSTAVLAQLGHNNFLIKFDFRHACGINCFVILRQLSVHVRLPEYIENIGMPECTSPSVHKSCTNRAFRVANNCLACHTTPPATGLVYSFEISRN